MKNIVLAISTALLTLPLLQSCDDLEVVESPNFEIAYESSVKVGEPVTFTVTNAPDFLNFYAGDNGHQYKFRERTNAEGTVTMSFRNSQKWGLGSNATDTFSVWYSKDYDGSGEAASVTAASWTDISDRFSISDRYDFTFQSSGVVDISDLADGNPIFLGFRYFSENTEDRGAEWYFDDFNIDMLEEGKTEPLKIANEKQPGFTPVDVQGIEDSWNAAKWYFDTAKEADGIWRMRGNSHRIVNEDWLITAPLNLTKVTPDSGVPLKTYSEKLHSFTHTYDTPGTYTLTFVANNQTIYGQETLVKEYTITVTDN